MNGKGSKPRNCFSKEFRQNYSEIDWSNSRRDKVQKMHGQVVGPMIDCFTCRGKGKILSPFTERYVKCKTCDGKQQMHIDVWRKKLGV